LAHHRSRIVTVEGPKGKLSHPLPEGIDVALEDGVLQFTRASEQGRHRSFHGLARALVANAVTGVTDGWTKVLEIQGVGYRGEVQGKEVHLALGYSHPVVFAIPEGVSIEIDKQNKITVSGADRQQVGQVSAELRKLRPPDAYKGKGIRYSDEVIRLKEGKSGAGGAG
jgi:large subunit ribosomal protein L6